MISDRLLTEVQRQEKYLSELPDDFQFPLFNTKHALESQRRNGYRDTAAAAREIVDNAIEAAATRIDVIFDHSRSARGKDLVTSIAFIDNGSGMVPKMIRYALSLGGGTHFDDPNFIGKFGFGLPNASINQTRRVEVYSRVSADEKIVCAASLDVTEVAQHGLQSVNPGEEADLPEFVRKNLKKKGVEFEQGTVVVWVLPDRLTYKTGAKLKEHLLDDFGVTYRYLLKGVEIVVEGTKVQVTDPLFLNPDGRFFLLPDPNEAEDAGGTVEMLDRTVVVKHFVDPDTGGSKVEFVKELSEIDENDPNLLNYGPVQVRVSRLPYGFAAGSGESWDEHSKKRNEIRTNGRGISFVRAGREIETLKVFPHTERDRAAGLGDWLVLQSYDYHWACEIIFKPELDEVFGITNDKQRVRPLEDLWRLLAQKDEIELDKVLRKEHRWQTQLRAKKKKERDTARRLAEPETSDEPSPAEMAAATVEVVTGKVAPVPERDRELIQDVTQKAIDEGVRVAKGNAEEVRKALEADQKRRPYKVEVVSDPGGPFYSPAWGANAQVVVRVNNLHPFYSSFYETLYSTDGSLKAKEAVDLLLIALSRAELGAEHEVTKELYRAQREENWSPFLAKGLQIMEQTLSRTEVPLEIDPDDEAAENTNEDKTNTAVSAGV